MLDEQDHALAQEISQPTLYTFGRISEHNVVLVCLPAGQTGTSSAAAIAGQMVSKFTSMRYILLVGIGGGVPTTETDIRLGDVVACHPENEYGGVVQYDFGKNTPSGFQRTGFLNAPPMILLSALVKLRANPIDHLAKLSTIVSSFSHLREVAGPDVLFEPTYQHVGGPECDSCSKERMVHRTPRNSRAIMVHYGTIASGNQVVRDGVTRDKLSSELGGVLCFEMEAAGLMNISPCLVIRGICDYADSHKNKKWQPYAAATAAAFAKLVLSVIPAAEVTTASTISSRVGSAPPKVCWFVPLARNQRFVGRSSQLSELEAKLFVESYCPKVAIIGLGGVGKTQIALELAYRTRAKRPECSIFWVSATSAENFHQSYLEIGRQLQIPGVENTEVDVKRLVQNYLSDENTGEWLLILDNVDDYDMCFKALEMSSQSTRLAEYLPKSSKGSVLLTSRSRKIAVEIADHVIRVHETDEQIAFQILEKSLIDLALLDDQKSVKHLLAQLTFLPLAVVQAASYINKNGISLSEYLNLWDDTEENIIELLTDTFEDEGRYQDVKLPVATTWLISFEQIRRHSPLATECLSFMSCLEPKMIPLSLLPPAQSKKKVFDALGTLTAYSFISRQQDSQSFDVHRLVHLATRNWLREQGSLMEWSGKAIRRLAEVFPDDDHKNRTLWRTYLSHARFVLASGLVLKGAQERLRLLEKSGLCLTREGRYSESRDQLAQVMEMRIDVLGKEHPDTLASMDNLAIVLRHQGNYEEARLLHQQALDWREKVLGKEHPDTLTSMDGLAYALWSQGKYKESESLNRRALDSRRRILGEGHPDTLMSFHNLALGLQSQSMYKEAEALHQQALARREKVLGKDHPDTLMSVHSLSRALRSQGKYKEGEALNRQALAGRQKVLGADHPDTLSSLSNLSSVLRSEGRYEEAEALDSQALVGRKKVLGADHPDTLSSLNNLACDLHSQGRYEEAEALDSQALAGRKKVLGADHPDTLSSLSNLSSVLWSEGRYEEAESLETQALAARQKVLGTEHPDTLTSLIILACILQSQDRYEEAEALDRQALAGRQKVLGAEHLHTLSSLNSLAFDLRSQGRYEESEALDRQALAGRQKLLGAEHLDTLSSLSNLASDLFSQRRYKEAEVLDRQALAGRQKVLGAEHPKTLNSFKNLTCDLRSQRRYEETEALDEHTPARRVQRLR